MSAERRTTPDHETTAWPKGVPCIVGNEGCERFSFYGMKAVLVVYLTSLYAQDGLEGQAARDSAQAMQHLFMAGVYGLPMIGALLADRWAGKYNTILWLSLVYCAGHLVLAFASKSLEGMGWGLGLIAIGSGGIKPCVSAHVGDQFGRGNWFRVRTIFQAFYWIVNCGSFLATLLIPEIRDRYGYEWAFGLPGVLMFIATLVFWMGRDKFVHVQAKPGGKLGVLDTLSASFLFLSFGHLFISQKLFDVSIWVLVSASILFVVTGIVLFVVRQRLEQDDGFFAITLHALGAKFRGTKAASVSGTTGRGSDHPLASNSFWAPAVTRFGGEATEGPVAVLKIISVFFLCSVFWALFEQHSTSWVHQAEDMNRVFFDTKLAADQIQALNPLMVMILIPLLNVVYRFSETKLGYQFTPLRRMTVGMFVAALSYVVVALVQQSIDDVAAADAGTVSVGWQVPQYVLITVAEVMISVTALEFAYTQAPRRMKSTLMGFWYLSISLGQVLVFFVKGIKDLAPVTSFWIFSGLMFVAAALFAIRARFYKEKDYTQ